MPDSIKDIIIRILQEEVGNIDFSKKSIEQLNLLPIDAVVSILQDIFDTETDRQIKGSVYSAFLILQDLDKVQFLVDKLEKSPDDWHYTYCYELRYFQDPRAVKKLCSVLLEDPDPDLRNIAAESLSNFDDTDAIYALEHARNHDLSENFEEILIADTAQWALDKIRSRMTPS